MNFTLTFPADRLTHARDIIASWEHLPIPRDEAIAAAFSIREEFASSAAYHAAADLVERMEYLDVCKVDACDHEGVVECLAAALRAKAP